MSALDIFLMNNKDLNIVFLTKFGSHLYGTNTEQSDQDFKGVFLPTLEQCILNQIPKSINYKSNKEEGKNSAEDTDIEIYSLQYFLKLLQKGDTGALDLLHAPLDNTDIVLRKTDIWRFLNDHRADFYTTNLSAFVGYCRMQASKYGIKGSRLADAGDVLIFLAKHDPKTRLSEIWENLPAGEHINKIAPDKALKSDFWLYQVCGRKLQETVTVDYAGDVIAKFHNEYGKRAKLAAENKGIDWKAVSHALRCAYEMKQVYTEGDITFPLKDAEKLLAVKNGECDYQDDVSPAIEMLMMQIEKHASASTYPAKVDIKKYEQWIVKIYSLQGKES